MFFKIKPKNKIDCIKILQSKNIDFKDVTNFIFVYTTKKIFYSIGLDRYFEKSVKIGEQINFLDVLEV